MPSKSHPLVFPLSMTPFPVLSLWEFVACSINLWPASTKLYERIMASGCSGTISHCTQQAQLFDTVQGASIVAMPRTNDSILIESLMLRPLRKVVDLVGRLPPPPSPSPVQVSGAVTPPKLREDEGLRLMHPAHKRHVAQLFGSVCSTPAISLSGIGRWD